MTQTPQESTTPAPHSIKRLFKNTSVYALGDMGLMLLSAVFAPLLTFYLTPAEFGTWSLSMMLLTGFSTVCCLALQGAITRYYYDHECDEPARRRFQGTILTFLLVWSFSLCVTMTWVGPALFESLFTDLPFWPFGAFVVWMAFVSVIGLIPKATWAAAERSKAFVGINLLGSTTNLAGSLGLVMLTSLGVLGLFWGRAASIVILAVPFVVYSVRKIGLAWNGSDLRLALAFSLPLVPHLLAHWVLGMSDRFIIDRYYGDFGGDAGLRAVGIYSAGYIFIDVVNMVAVAMNRAWVPQFTRAYEDPSQRPFVGRSITYFILAVGGISMTLFLLAPLFVQAFFEERYVGAAEIGAILAVGGLFQGTYYIYVAGLFYFKKNLLIPVITIVSGGTNVALNLLWIPTFGLVGAAWATVIGYLILALGVRWGCRRHTRLPFESTRLMQLTGVLVGTALLGHAFTGCESPMKEFLAKLALILTVPLSLHFLGFWQDDEVGWAKNKLRAVAARLRPPSGS